MKKIWMAGIACLVVLGIMVVLGITIPVIASNIGKADIKDEEKPYTGTIETEIKAEAETEVEAEAETEVKAEIETEQKAGTQSTETPQAEVQTEVKAQPICSSYVDANGDGICDHCVTGTQNPACGSYVDANGDGICDHCVAGSSQNSGNQWGGGHHRENHHGGGHHGRR